MERKKELLALAGRVEAGDDLHNEDIVMAILNRSFNDTWIWRMENGQPLTFLDAALKLMEEVLPGWGAQIEIWASGSHAKLIHEHSVKINDVYVEAQNPARALLAAILRALAEEEG